MQLKRNVMTSDSRSTYERLLRAVGHTGLPGASRLVRKAAPAYDSGCSFRSSLFDLTYEGDLSELIDWHIYFLGAYARAELAFLACCAEILAAHYGTVNFYDVGANAGQHSLFMARKVSQVHAFEPSPTIADRFRRNVAINALNNVILHPVALADADSEETLGSGFRGNSGSRSLDWTLPDGSTERVQVRDADAYFGAHGLPRMHLLKIDVEGHEQKVLRGLASRLGTDRPLIVMELIGSPDCKGGFRSEGDLRTHLYPEHELRSLESKRRRNHLARFDWACEAAVIIPSEIRGCFGV
jgi:FkbM family methyltransferase